MKTDDLKDIGRFKVWADFKGDAAFKGAQYFGPALKSGSNFCLNIL